MVVCVQAAENHQRCRKEGWRQLKVLQEDCFAACPQSVQGRPAEALHHHCHTGRGH